MAEVMPVLASALRFHIEIVPDERCESLYFEHEALSYLCDRSRIKPGRRG